MSGRFVSRLPLENDVSIRLLSISGSSYDSYKTNLITGGQRSWVTVVDRILFGSHRSPQEVSYLPLDFIFCPFLPLKEGTHHQQPFLLSISRISFWPPSAGLQQPVSTVRKPAFSCNSIRAFFPRVEKAEGASRASLGSKTFKFV